MTQTLPTERLLTELRNARTPILLAMTASLILVATALRDQPALAVANLPIAAAAAASAVIDARTRLIPRQLVMIAAATSAPLFVVATVGSGAWSSLLRAVAACVVVGGVYLAVALVSPRSIGMGDVRLVALVAVGAGYFSWPAVVAIAVLPQLLAAPAAVMSLIRKGRHSHLALGPYLTAAYLLVVVLQP